MAQSLSNIYDYYYTAADSKVFLSDSLTGKTVYVDLLSGIGYDYTTSSVPVYTLGSGLPAFFSRGNFLGQGMFVLPFKDEQYLKVMLQYIFNQDITIQTPKDSSRTVSYREGMTDEEFEDLAYSNTAPADNIINIATVSRPFDIKLVFDNSNPYYESDGKIIILKDCKLVGESLDISSNIDKITQTGYKFYFKDIQRESKI